MLSLRERLEPYTAGESTDRGWTVVLIDNSEGGEGDFVYVESFDTFAQLRRRRGLGEQLVAAAKDVLRNRS